MKMKELMERILGLPLVVCLTLLAIMFADRALAGSLSSILNADTAHFSYDSSTQTYTLLADQTIQNDFSVSDKNYKFDLNGHRLSLCYNDGGTISTGSYAIEFQNSTSTIGVLELVQITGRVIIGKNVKLAYFIRGLGVQTLEVQTGGMISSSRILYDDTLLSKVSTDIGTYAPVRFSAESQLVLQPGAKISQQGLEDDNEYKHYMGLIGSYYGVYWGGWVDMARKFVPEGCTLEGPDADGYYTVVALPQDVVVSEAEGDLAIDTRTNRTAEKGVAQNFAYSLTAWGATAEQGAATVTYTHNGGPSQTLGSYTPAIAEYASWLPEKSGTYVFTHQPGGLTATFAVPQKPTITVESVRQQYPFNKVDVQYLIEELDPSATYSVALKSVVDGITNAVNVSGAPATEGSHKVTFDASNADVAPGLQNIKKKIKLVGELYAE